MRAFKKYESQPDSAVFDYKFASPLMRLAYVMNETDKMLELFLSEESKTFTSSLIGNILMNKLYELKRYKDCVKVYKKIFDKQVEMKEEPTGDGKARYFPHLTVQLVAEALLEKNDSEALTQMKEILSDLEREKFDFNKQTNTAVILLAIQQEDFQYAYDCYVKKTDKYELPLDRNLEIFTLCNIGKVPEALKIVKTLESNSHNVKFQFFSETVEKLSELTKKSGDQALEHQFDEISSWLTEKMTNKTMKEYFLQIQTISPADQRRMRESDGNQFGKDRRYNNQRNESFNESSFTRPRRPFVRE